MYKGQEYEVIVSIHAPARGATATYYLPLPPQTVSIHAPARGATLLDVVSAICQRCFNPRPCARGDQRLEGCISSKARFQSTPLREGRLSSAISVSSSRMFQSTPLREGRHLRPNISAANNVFQSTPLREGRLIPQ